MELHILYVLDFSTKELHQYDILEDQQIEEVEEFITDQGHKLSDVQFMYGEDIKIIKH